MCFSRLGAQLPWPTAKVIDSRSELLDKVYAYNPKYILRNINISQSVARHRLAFERTVYGWLEPVIR